MNPETEAKELRGLVAVLQAKADAWHDINFHAWASALEDAAEALERVAIHLDSLDE